MKAPSANRTGSSATRASYEALLDRDRGFALSEGSRHLEGGGRVHDTLRRIARRLDDLGVDYAVVGGMALFEHGYRRFTEDVDILVTRAHLRRIHDELEGLGYLPPFEGSKHLRDTETGVRIEFLVTGDFPGDGKPKPVAFPSPANATVQIDGLYVLDLQKLIETKLASGMTSPQRIRDLADVQELIRLLGIGQEFADRLDPYVRDEFLRRWNAARTQRYLRILPEPPDAEQAAALQREGLVIEARGGRTVIVTTDPELARKHDMHDETDFLDNQSSEQ
jgi:hypothetical protein